MPIEPNSGEWIPDKRTPPPISKPCECGHGQLVVRVNSHNGSRFLGCTDYPHCTRTETVPAYLELIASGAAQLPGMEAL